MANQVEALKGWCWEEIKELDLCGYGLIQHRNSSFKPSKRQSYGACEEVTPMPLDLLVWCLLKWTVNPISLPGKLCLFYNPSLDRTIQVVAYLYGNIEHSFMSKGQSDSELISSSPSLYIIVGVAWDTAWSGPTASLHFLSCCFLFSLTAGW